MGQRSKIVIADRYTHALVDYREVNRAALLERVHPVLTRVHTSHEENAAFAAAF